VKHDLELQITQFVSQCVHVITRNRIRDFTTVLGCRFPTITDIRSPPIAKRALRVLSSWRYRFERYDQPWELDLSKQFIKLHDPRAASL